MPGGQSAPVLQAMEQTPASSHVPGCGAQAGAAGQVVEHAG
jgi:hypothetical protein